MEEVEAPPPAFETGPPFGRDFLAHLQAGFYDDNPDLERVWERVRADPDAAAFIERLDEVQRRLRDTGP